MTPDQHNDAPSEVPPEVADALAVPISRRHRVTVCRECTAVFLTSIDSQTKWGTVCTPCLQAMGCV